MELGAQVEVFASNRRTNISIVKKGKKGKKMNGYTKIW